LTSPLAPSISLPPLGPKNNQEEGEGDKTLFSVYNQPLTGKNDVIVMIYDANMEIDIAAFLWLIHPLIQTLLLI
jgi:hypothetical protein